MQSVPSYIWAQKLSHDSGESPMHGQSIVQRSSVLGVDSSNLFVSFYNGNRGLVLKPLVEEAERVRLLLSEVCEISSALHACL